MIQEKLEIFKNRGSYLGSCKNLWNITVDLIYVVIGAKRALPKKEHIGNIGIQSKMVVLQGTGIVYYARTLQKFLQFEELC